MTDTINMNSNPDFQDVHTFEAWTPLPFPDKWAPLQREERETLVNLEYTSPIGTVYTNEPRIINKMRKLCETHPDSYKVSRIFTRDGETTAVEISFLRRLLTFRGAVKLRGKRETEEADLE